LSDSINKIAAKVDGIVENLGRKENVACEICKKTYTDHPDTCRGYNWRISFSKGIWYFNLFRHKDEIWWTSVEGTIEDILLKALEGLFSGDWKKNKESQ